MNDMIITERQNIIDIADAIREKTGITSTLKFPSEFIKSIADISNSDDLPDGIQAIASGTYTPVTDIAGKRINIAHNLGQHPDFIFVISLEETPDEYVENDDDYLFAFFYAGFEYWLNDQDVGEIVAYWASDQADATVNVGQFSTYGTTTTFTIPADRYFSLKGGTTYRWVACRFNYS